MTNRKKKAFKGALNKPIQIPYAPKKNRLLPEEQQEADFSHRMASYESYVKATVSTESLKKLVLLLEHFDIPYRDAGDSRWLLLSQALAETFVPGFKVERAKKRGHKTKWTDTVKAELYFSVERLLQEKQQKDSTTESVSWACHQLLKQEPWNTLVSGRGAGKKPSAKTLQNKYDDAKESVVVKAMLHLRQNGLLDSNAIFDMIQNMKKFEQFC